MKYGLRHSLLTAIMPTASTSHLRGNAEACEPFLSNIFRRSVVAGEFMVVNKQLVEALQAEHLWDAQLKEELVASEGSIQSCSIVPQSIRERFKTLWEISQRVLIDHAVDRGYFIDQSQSLN